MTDDPKNETALYLDEVQDEAVLTREQEVELFKRYEAGDTQAREEIVRANLRFVIKIAYEFFNRGLPLADLIQEGNVGLLDVIPRFNWRKGYRFSTYAAFWIRQAIQTAIRRQSSMIRLPVRKSRLLGHLSEHIQQFRFQNGREPTAQELSERTGVSETEIERLLALRDGVMSLDAQEDSDDTCLMDTIAEPDAKSPRDRASETQMRSMIGRVLDYLGERERRVLQLRYGFENGKTLSLRRTSKMVGLSQEGVRRIELRALEKLRRPHIRQMIAGLV